MKKKNIALLFLAIPALMLASCGGNNPNPSEPNTDKETSEQHESSDVQPGTIHAVTFHFENGQQNEVVNVEHGECVTKPSQPSKEGYLFAGWFDQKEGGRAFQFQTPIVKDLDLYARWTEDKPITSDILEAALNLDYSNCQVLHRSTNEFGSPFIMHNIDGYNIAEGYVDGIGDGQYLYYHDYEGQSYMYWETEELGGAWIRQGKKTYYGYINLGLDDTYFKADLCFSKINAADFNYSHGAFHCSDPMKVAKIVESGAFNFIWANDIAEISIILDDTSTYVSKIMTFDSDNPDDERCTVTEIFNYNRLGEWKLSPLPPKPTKANVKTWYEWKQEEEPTFDNLITEITLNVAEGETNEMYVGEKKQLHYELNPIKPDYKELELQVEGPEDGMKVNYDFGDNNLVVESLKLGTYNVYVYDKVTKVRSNPCEIKVIDTKASIFTNCLYDLELSFDTEAPSLYNYEENGKVATFEGSKQCFKAVKGVENGDNSKFTPFTNAIELFIGDGDSMNVEGDDAYVTFTLDTPINAMSFTYGALFANHVGNINGAMDVMDAKILTSKDGVTFDLVEDWTQELKANITHLTTRRKDIAFEEATQYVRIAFDSKYIGKNLTFAMDSWSFFVEA